jgi:hypothetical protein
MDGLSEAVAFSFFTIKSWPKQAANKVKSWIYPMATFSLFENVAGRLGDPRGNSRWFPFGLVWAKRHDVSGRRP